MAEIVFAIDIGTTKVCALVGEVRNGQMQIIGVGVETSRGMRRGIVTDVNEASVAIAKAVEGAERTSGYELSEAVVSMAGEHVSSLNNTASISLGRRDGAISADDVAWVLKQAQTISLPPQREIIHVVPSRYRVDDNAVQSPIGMHGSRLEVRAHIVTGDKSALLNLGKCTDNVGIQVREFVLNSLASAEAVLKPSEMEMGVMLIDIGGGTTDIALYADGAVVYTAIIPMGSYHITNDIAIGLRVPFEDAERIKIQYGDCCPGRIEGDSIFSVQPFGEEIIRVGRRDLAEVIEARVEELFSLVVSVMEASGYQGLLPAGIVLTGGGSQLRGVTEVAHRVLNAPTRIAEPKNLVGLVDALKGPAYATGVGLLRWALSDRGAYRPQSPQPNSGRSNRRLGGGRMGGILRALLPD